MNQIISPKRNPPRVDVINVGLFPTEDQLLSETPGTVTDPVTFTITCSTMGSGNGRVVCAAIWPMFVSETHLFLEPHPLHLLQH